MTQDNLIFDDGLPDLIRNTGHGSIEVGFFDNTIEEEGSSSLVMASEFKYKILHANKDDVYVGIYEENID